MIPVLQPAGADAAAIAPLAWALLVGGVLVFGAVMALLARAVAGPPRPVRAAWWIGGGGIALPALVLAGLHVANLRDVERLHAAPPPGVPTIAVTGRMWWWELRANLDGQGDVVTANELVLPQGRDVRLALASDGVIHSLWVPALAGKIDLVPGRIRHLTLRADAAGTWRAPCAEFCGSGHAQMVLTVRALPVADWQAWLAAQRAPARAPQTAQQQAGLAVYRAQRCDLCHALRADGAPEPARAGDGFGPDLTHLASRVSLAAGASPNDAAALRAWLEDPRRIKPAARMPAYGHLAAADLDALVAYLRSLQ